MITPLGLDDSTLNSLSELMRTRGDKSLVETIAILVKQNNALQKVAKLGFNELIARNSNSGEEQKVPWYRLRRDFR